MGVLDADLITRLVRATNDSKPEKNEGVLYGTVVDDGIRKYVHLDGSDGSVNTPVVTTTDIKAGDTVLVQLKNHTATVTGNITDPAIGVKRAEGIESSITQTASEIRLEVKNEISKVSSRITQTASEIRAEVTDEVNGLNSLISQTASEIRSEVSNSVSGLNTLISQTASEIRSEVSNSVSGLNSKITQTEKDITSIVSNQEGFSQFKQTVEGFLFEDNDGSVKIDGGNIVLTGSITWTDFSDELKVDVEQVSADAASAETSADNALKYANNASGYATYAKDYASSASTSASNASTYASNASTYANNAKNSATNASALESNAKTYANNAASYASQALKNANSASESATAIRQIHSDITGNLPAYLQYTTINEVSLSSPVILGGRFYAIGQDSWLEMESDGLRMYTEDSVKPKVALTNDDTYLELALGAGDKNGNSRLFIGKGTNYAAIVYKTSEGEECGFFFYDDGTIGRFGDWA